VPTRAESKPWDLIRIMPAWESETAVESHLPVSQGIVALLLPMQIYTFAHQLLAWSVTVAVLGFVTFPWLIVAYKIWHGNKPIDEDLKDELLTRSWFAGWALGAAAIVFVLLDYLCASETLQLPEGPVHVVFFISYLALAGWWLMYFFSMEDFFQGLSLAVIYLYIPTAVLYGFSLLFNNPLQVYVLTWLVEPKA
jgi:hypothetical protein